MSRTCVLTASIDRRETDKTMHRLHLCDSPALNGLPVPSSMFAWLSWLSISTLCDLNSAPHDADLYDTFALGSADSFVARSNHSFVAILFATMVADVLCDVCEKPGETFFNKVGKSGCVSCICRTRYYRSKGCQNDDWQNHKPACSRYPEYRALRKVLRLTSAEPAQQVNREAAKRAKRHPHEGAVITDDQHTNSVNSLS